MSRLIEKEGKHYIQGKVVMLATDNLNNSLKGYLDRSILFEYKKEYITIPAEKGFTGHFHLYITSDDEIKVGDWYIFNGNIFQCKIANWEIKDRDTTNCKKIIATTDSSLKIDVSKEHNAKNCKVVKAFPKPSESFIKAYIEAYNNGNVIEDVLVEVEKVFFSGFNFDYELKLKDNNIIIKKVKDSWNREEVAQIIENFSWECTQGVTQDQVKEWLEKNL